MEIEYTPDALKVLRRMPRDVSRRIQQKMVQYTENPESLRNNVSQLQGTTTPTYRMRVGGWRVIFTQDGKVLVIKIAARGSIY